MQCLPDELGSVLPRAGLRRKEAMALEWEETEEAPWLDLARDRIILRP